MNKWPRIKSKIHQERLDRVSGIFKKISENIRDKKTCRNEWVSPLTEWTSYQIFENNSVRLSLQEYAHFKAKVDSFNDALAFRNNEKPQVIQEFHDAFITDYVQSLESKENELKLEVAALIVEDKQFPLDLFAEWYNKNWNLPPEKFNEELGNFWGDVWKHAAQGAGVGATGGGLGGMATGGLGGSFIGAGLGGLGGGLAGGLYGAGKHLLQRVWQYRQTQRNFEQTRDKALETLKRLRELSKGFDMHPNFLSSLDAIINQLGTVRAYRLAPDGTSRHATDQEVQPGKAVNPIQQAPQATPPAATVPPATSAPTTTAPAASNPEAMPPEANPAVPPEMMKPKRVASAATLAALAKGRQVAADNRLKAAEAKRQQLLAAGIGNKPPEPTSPETQKEGIHSNEDIVSTFDKAVADKDDKTLIKLGNALYYLGKGEFNHGTKQMELQDENEPINWDHFNQAFQGDYGTDKDAAKKEIELAVKYVSKLKQGALAQPGTPTEMKGEGNPVEKIPNQEEVTKHIQQNQTEMMNMSKEEFLKFIQDNHLETLVPKDKDGQLKLGKEVSASRFLVINKIKEGLGIKPPAPTAQPNESAFTKYGKLVSVIRG